MRWLREFYWRRLKHYDGEICDLCGKRVIDTVGTYWNADDDLWMWVFGLDQPVVCLPCFAQAAARNGVARWFIKAVVDDFPVVVRAEGGAPCQVCERPLRDHIQVALDCVGRLWKL